jgi:hypothetical protein
MVWDSEDTSLPVPDDYPAPADATSLAAAFVAADGRNLIELLDRALRQAMVEQQPVLITTLDQLPPIG